MSKRIKSHLEDLGLDGFFLSEDDTDKCYEVFIEFVLGPETSSINVDMMTDEEHAQLIRALAHIEDELEG